MCWCHVLGFSLVEIVIFYFIFADWKRRSVRVRMARDGRVDVGRREVTEDSWNALLYALLYALSMSRSVGFVMSRLSGLVWWEVKESSTRLVERRGIATYTFLHDF